jgi:CHASE2 domain-containing sensor protein
VLNRPVRVRRRLIVLSGLVPVLVTAALALSHPPFFSRLDDAVYDTVVRSSSARKPAGRVAIVDVDDRSLATIGQWPWRRDVMGRLIAGLKDAGAAVVAMDVIFAESDRHDVASDNADDSVPTSPDRALASIVRDPRVVLGYGLTFDPRGTPTEKCALHTLPVAVVQRGGDDDTPPFFHATGAVCNIPVLAGAAVRSGYLNAAPDSDGILRRVPLLADINGRVLPSLALSAVTALNGGESPSLDVSTVNSSTFTLGGLRVPLDGRSNLLLAFRGKKRTFPYISAADVLGGTVERDALRGKIVLVGTTALGTREVVATPLDTQFVGVEVQATTIDNLLQQDFAHRSVYATVIDLLLVVTGGAVVAVLCATAGMTVGVLGAIGLLAAFWVGAPWLLGAQRVFISPLFPTLAVVGTLSVMTLARFTVERRRATRADVEKTAAQRLMIQTLLALTETRDAETGRHSRRTQQYARLLAEPLSTHPAFRQYLTKDRVDLLSCLAPLHDIGKVGIPDAVLNKPGKLTPEELAQMRRHPELGRDVILRAEARVGVRDDATLQLAKDIVYTHHERWDGKGYPQGLSGAGIPIPGRIMAVVDVYDAVHARSLYCASSSHEETVQVIERGRGTHFDPDVVDAFLSVSKAFEQVSTETLEDAPAPMQERAR